MIYVNKDKENLIRISTRGSSRDAFNMLRILPAGMPAGF